MIKTIKEKQLNKNNKIYFILLEIKKERPIQA